VLCRPGRRWSGGAGALVWLASVCGAVGSQLCCCMHVHTEWLGGWMSQHFAHWISVHAALYHIVLVQSPRPCTRCTPSGNIQGADRKPPRCPAASCRCGAAPAGAAPWHGGCGFGRAGRCSACAPCPCRLRLRVRRPTCEAQQNSRQASAGLAARQLQTTLAARMRVARRLGEGPADGGGGKPCSLAERQGAVPAVRGWRWAGTLALATESQAGEGRRGGCESGSRPAPGLVRVAGEARRGRGSGGERQAEHRYVLLQARWRWRRIIAGRSVARKACTPTRTNAHMMLLNAPGQPGAAAEGAGRGRAC
jgi:hypothetical protein